MLGPGGSELGQANERRAAVGVARGLPCEKVLEGNYLEGVTGVSKSAGELGL